MSSAFKKRIGRHPVTRRDLLEIPGPFMSCMLWNRAEFGSVPPYDANIILKKPGFPQLSSR
jgi:hypothetical protein